MDFSKLEWWEDASVQGGQRGLSIDFKDETVTSWNGESGPISEWPKDEILWVIESNLDYYKQRAEKLRKRAAITERHSIKLENGAYKIMTVLSEEVKQKYADLIEECNKMVVEIGILKENYLKE